MHKFLVVAAGFIAAVALGEGAQAQSWCTPGAKLDVIWKGSWYPATAKSAGPGGCLIGYDGYGASWDERVGSDRAGPLDGQAGKLDKGMIRLYNQSRSAMITDCEPT